MKRTREELEREYDKVDPWGYQTNPADIERKRIILEVLNQYGPFEIALDLACGEGWITKDIPSQVILGTEASIQAMQRWDPKIRKWNGYIGDLDLVMVTGALYENYDWESFVNYMNEKSKKYILTCNIADREFAPAVAAIQGKLIKIREFPYHRSPEEQFTQRLRVYKR